MLVFLCLFELLSFKINDSTVVAAAFFALAPAALLAQYSTLFELLLHVLAFLRLSFSIAIGRYCVFYQDL